MEEASVRGRHSDVFLCHDSNAGLVEIIRLSPKIFASHTVRPRGTRPQGTRTSLVHDFKKGSKIFEISDFGT